MNGSRPRADDGDAGAEVFAFPGSPRRGGGYGFRVRFGVLGTLTVLDDDSGVVRLGGPARRRLLAALLARLGRVVPVDTLVEDLWSEAPPATADKTLQSHVVRLRDDLGRPGGSSPVITEPGGYRLDVDRGNVDAWCFERDLEVGRTAFAAGDPAAATRMLEQALSWWRGPAYAEFPDAAFAVSERLRLGELRALAQEMLTDAALALGGGAELVADLELRVREEPYRERSWEQLVLALYRSGRQRDALTAYRRARERLVDDLGLEPAPSLRSLEARVLAQDPSLLAPVAGAAVVLPIARAPAAQAHPAAAVAGFVVGACPYRGLAAYREDDASVFVGRERLTAEIAGRLVDNDLIVLTGASGAGKSSLVRAGLVPVLSRGAIPGSAAWRVQVATPGRDTLAVLDGVQADLLVVDQAEELFTLSGGDDWPAVGRRLAALLSAGTRLVLVLRSDFYGRLAELKVFTNRIGAATVLVGPMTEEEVRRVVAEPAATAGVPATPDLAEAVVADVRGQAGSLPLLSAALERTWHQRTGDRLTIEAYQRAGGVSGAMEAMAEDAFESLDPDAAAVARRMLLLMATRSGNAWVRRPVRLEEVAPPSDATAGRALSALVTSRLVTVSSSTVELTHDALLLGWPRLRKWLDERALVADQLEQLARLTAAWEQADRPDADLLRGPRLQAALDWSARHPDDFSVTEREYLAASRAHVEAELTRERRRRRWFAATTVTATAAALVAALVGGVALVERSNADRSARSADARRLAAQSYTVHDRTTALLLAAASYRLQDSPDTRGALWSAVQAYGGALFRMPTENRILWVGAPADGSHVLVADNSSSVLVVNPSSRTVTGSFQIQGEVADVSPDGSLLALCGTASGGVTVVDGNTGVLIDQLTLATTESVSQACARFTADGRYLVTAALVPRADGSRPKPDARADALAVYDVQDWSLPPRILPLTVPIASFDTGSALVAVQLSDGSLEVLRAADLHIVASGRPASARQTCPGDSDQCVVAIDPAGDRVAFLDPADPRSFEEARTSDLSAPGRPGQGLGTPITHLAFSPDGTRLAAAAGDGSVVVGTVPGATTVVSESGNGVVEGLAWTGTGAGAALYTGGLDSELVAWDLRSVPRSVQFSGTVPVDDGDDTGTGQYVVGTRPVPGGSDGAEEVVRTDLRTGASVAWPTPIHAGMYADWVVPNRDASQVALSLASTGADPQAVRFEVLDLRTGAVLLDRAETTPPGVDASISFGGVSSPDGRTLYAVTGQHTVQVVDIASGQLLRTLTVRFGDSSEDLQWPIPLAVDPRGNLLVLGYQPRSLPVAGSGASSPPHRSQAVALLDPDTGRVIAQADVGSLPVTTWAWSPQASRLVVGTAAGTIQIFDAATLAPMTDRVAAHHGSVLAVSYSPDASMVASSGDDGTVALLDSTTLRPIGVPTTLGRLGSVWAWFTSAGQIVGTMPHDVADPNADTRFTMPGAPVQWLADACTFAGRDLTVAEWGRYVGSQPYQPTCPTPR